MNENEPNTQAPSNTPATPVIQPPVEANTAQQTAPVQQVQAAPQPTQVTPETSGQSQQPEIPKRKKESGIFSFIGTLAAAFALVFVINTFFFQSYKVFGSSMFPTLHDGDRLIISKIGKTTARAKGKVFVPHRGDIIVFVDPQKPDLQLIKRVIGLPGERVVVKDGKLTVYNTENPDGFNPDTSGAYSADIPPSSGAADVTVPEGHIFVSGDNREGSNSLDSRNELGTVPEELIVGKLKVRIYPFNDAKFF